MSDMKRFMQRIELGLPSSRAMIVACCVVVGVFPFFVFELNGQTYLGWVIGLLALSVADTIIPGSASTWPWSHLSYPPWASLVYVANSCPK